jgi:hypothetical protein
VVVVGDHDVEPVRVTTVAERPVVFVNASATRLDVRFLGSAAKHAVSPVNGSVAAVVLPSGRYRFVVWFDDGRHLHGIVEAVETPPAQEAVPVCEGLPPARICMEPLDLTALPALGPPSRVAP